MPSTASPPSTVASPPGERVSTDGDPYAGLLVAGLSDCGLFWVDPDGVVRSWNEGAARITGYAASEIVGRPLATLHGPDAAGRGEPEGALREAAEHGRSERDGWRVRRDGSQRWVAETLTARRDAAGRLLGYAMLMRDATERLRDDELQRSESLYGGLMALASDAIVTTDAEQRILLFNRGAEETFGYTATEVLGRPLDVLLPERFGARHRAEHVPLFGGSVVAARRMAERREVFGRRKNGEEFPAEVAISRMTVDGALRYAAIVRDVTDRRRRDDALRESERRYRSLVASTYDGIFVCDGANRILLANPAFAAICGRPLEELIGTRVGDLIAPEDLAEAPLRRQELEAAGGRLQTARTLLRPDGTRVRVDVGVSQLGAGEIQCVVHDVTERCRLEEQLRASEHRFHSIFDSAFQFVGLLAPDGTVLEANRTALEFGSVTAEQVVGRPFWETPWWAHSEAARERLREAVRDAAAGRFVRYETVHVAADGRVIDIDFSLKPVLDEAGRVVLLIPEGRDITTAKHTALRLRESEETFRSAFEHSGIGMALVGLDGRWHRVNRALCEIVGYDESEMQERTFQDITHPDDLDADLAFVRQLLDGERTWYQLEKRYVHKDGRIVWVLLNGSVVRDSAGAPRFFIAQVQDVSARRTAVDALERQREELARSNAELEQFAYVASHDLKEPLRAVASYTQLLAERYAGQLDERAQKYVRHAVEGATRMGALIDDLLALSRVGTAGRPFTRVDLNAVLRDTLRGLGVCLADAGGAVTVDRLPAVTGDAAQLGQVFQNLIGNAIKFRRPNVAPRVHVSAAAGEHEWVLTVSDNGIGIEPRFAEQVFVIFKRLHSRDEYPGTGIGLAICKKIVERHGGRIWVEPAVCGGSVFRLTLPRAEAITEAAQEER